MKTLILNFTGDNYHWGCHGTSYALQSRLAKAGPVDVVDVTRNQDFRFHQISESRDYGQSAVFAKNHPDITAQLESCDQVVVNGEGTLHGEENFGPKALLAMISAAKKRRKTVFLINHSIFPSDTIAPSSIDRIYIETLREADGIATRDSASHAFYVRHGLKAHEAFDCLPLFIADRFRNMLYPDYAVGARRDDYVVVTSGVNTPLEEFRNVLDLAIDRYGKTRRVVYMFGSSGRHSAKDKECIDFIQSGYDRKKYVDIVEAKRFSNFLSMIRDAHLLITARFHYCIAAMCTGTPFLAIGSNTPKTDIVTADVSYDGEVFNPKHIETERITQVLDEFESGIRTLKVKVSLDDFSSRALKNFEFLNLPREYSPDRFLSREINVLSKQRRFAQVAYLYQDMPGAVRTNLSDSILLFVAKGYVSLGDPEEGALMLRSILQRSPTNPVAQANLLLALMAAQDAPAAFAAACEAEKIFPANAAVLLYAAQAAVMAYRFDEAIRMLEAGIAADPEHFPCRLLLASLYIDKKGQIQKGVLHAREAVRILPEKLDAQRILGNTLWRLGRLGEGFDHFRSCLKSERLFKSFERPYGFRHWSGENLTGKLLVLPETEHGLRYELLCSTLLPSLSERGVQVVFEMTEKLIPIMKPLYPHVHFLPFIRSGHPTTMEQGIEAQAYFTDLCCLLRRTIADFRPSGGEGPKEPRIPMKRPLLIGISWFTTSPIKERTIPLEQWRPLFEGINIPVEWVNLQYGDVAAEIDDFAHKGGPSVIYDPMINYFDDIQTFMSRLRQVDIVISIDNSTVFFAGLIGKPTFALIPPQHTFWIWGANDTRSYWFPSVEIFRKSPNGDWEELLMAVRNRIMMLGPYKQHRDEEKNIFQFINELSE